MFDQNQGSIGAGDSVIERVGDVTEDRLRGAIVTDTLAKFGRIDVLIHSAGVGLYQRVSNTDRDYARRLFEVNVHAAWQLNQAVLPHMLRQRAGTIVSLGSVAGAVALPWAAAYCASKASLQSMTDALRRELSATGVSVIDARLGIVDTPFRTNVLDGQAPENVSRIRTVVSPDLVAERIFQAAIRGRSSTIYVPRIARLFCLADAVSPRLMDWYLRRYFRGTHQPSESHLRRGSSA